MTPPETPEDGTAARGRTLPAVSACLPQQPLPSIGPLRDRADFLRAARARRQQTAGMMVQGRRRGGDKAGIRLGLTCSKKVGNAVARNRAKRRLRAVARLVLPVHGRPGWDYVLIGRAGITASRPFADLQNDLIYALHKIHRRQ